jgi:hypothetical protein
VFRSPRSVVHSFTSYWRRFALAGILAVACGARVLAQTLVIFPSGVGNPASGFAGSLGQLFTVNQSVTVSQLAYWDNNQDGVTQGGPISVALFTRTGTASGAIIAGTEIDFTGTMGTLTGPTYINGQFRTLNLVSPVTLTAGDYAVVAWGFGNGADSFVGGNGTAAGFDTFGGALTFLAPGYYGSPGGTFPTTGDGGGTYLAGSFVVAAAIPEPGTWAAIAGVAALAAAGWRAARRRSTVVL